MKKSKMKNTKHIILLLLLVTTLAAQEELTLSKVVAIGLENNYGIKISEQNIQIAENNNTWARAGKYPTIDLNGSFNNNLINDNNPASFLQGIYYTGSLGATADVNWTVYNGGRIRISKQQLELDVNQQRLNAANDIHLLMRDLYQQYYDVIFQQEQLLVLDEVLQLSKSRLEFENIRKEYGTSNAYNIVQFESSVMADSNAVISQIQKVEIAKRTLFNTMDIEGIGDYTFTERLNISTEKIDEGKLKTVLSEENYTLKSLTLISALNQLNTGMAKAARKPTVNVGGSVGFAENAFKFFADDPNTGEPFDLLFSNRLIGNVFASVNYNLYDGGVRRADVQNAKIQEDIDRLSILEAKAELNNQLDILIENYNSQLDLLNITDRQIQLAQQNLDITEQRFKSGQVTSLDYRNVQNQFINAAYSKVGAIYSLLITKSEIDFLVGVFE